jgi:hypothetical protein
MKTGAELIAEERGRQPKRGYNMSHDDQHRNGELARAAACYAMKPHWDTHAFLRYWPWEPDEWKPGDRIRELIKAGALIAAEIDRLHRVEIAQAQMGEMSRDGNLVREYQILSRVEEKPRKVRITFFCPFCEADADGVEWSLKSYGKACRCGARHWLGWSTK